MFKSTYLSLLALLFASTVFSQITWQPLHGPTSVSDVIIKATDQSGRIFLQRSQDFFSSTDNGDSWLSSTAGLPPEQVSSLSALLPLSTGKVLARLDNGYYQYDAVANSWSLDSQFDAHDYLSLDDQQRLWRITDGNISYSTDEGQTFNLVLGAAQIEGMPVHMANHNAQHNLVLVAQDFGYSLYHFTIDGTLMLVKEGSADYLDYNPISGTAFLTDADQNWRSVDGGLTWEEVTLQTYPITSRIKRILCESATKIWAVTIWGLFVSEDDGATWSAFQIDEQIVHEFYISPNGTFFLSQFCSDNDFLRSTDQGQTWTDISKSFTYPTTDDILVAKNGELYAHNCYQYDRSNDGGDTWSPAILIDSLPARIRQMVVHPDGDLFAISPYSNIVRSTDGGNNWEKTTQPTSLPWNEDATYLQADPFGNLYLFFKDGPSYKSADKGQTWQTIQFSPHVFSYFPFLFHPNGDIYVVINSTVQHYLADQDTGVVENILPLNGQFIRAERAAMTAQGNLYFIDNNTNLNLYRYLGNGVAELSNFPGDRPDFIATAPNGQTFVVSRDSLFQSDNSGLQWTFAGKMPYSHQPLNMEVGTDQHLYLSYYYTVIYRSVEPVLSAAYEPKQTYSVRVFPNPFHDLLSFQIPGAQSLSSSTLLLMDVTGRLVKEKQFTGNNCQLRCADLPAGMYFYALLGEQGQWVAAGRVLAD